MTDLWQQDELVMTWWSADGWMLSWQRRWVDWKVYIALRPTFIGSQEGECLNFRGEIQNLSTNFFWNTTSIPSITVQYLQATDPEKKNWHRSEFQQIWMESDPIATSHVIRCYFSVASYRALHTLNYICCVCRLLCHSCGDIWWHVMYLSKAIPRTSCGTAYFTWRKRKRHCIPGILGFEGDQQPFQWLV